MGDRDVVHPSDWRGGGAGRRLLEHAIGFSGNMAGLNEQNGQALGFYRRMGFEVVGRSERDG
jgi:putative acetyltransferase